MVNYGNKFTFQWTGTRENASASAGEVLQRTRSADSHCEAGECYTENLHTVDLRAFGVDSCDVHS